MEGKDDPNGVVAGTLFCSVFLKHTPCKLLAWMRVGKKLSLRMQLPPWGCGAGRGSSK